MRSGHTNKFELSASYLLLQLCSPQSKMGHLGKVHMDFIIVTTLYSLHFPLSLRGSLSNSLKQSGFVECLRQNECFMSCEPLQNLSSISSVSCSFYSVYFSPLLHHIVDVSGDWMSDTAHILLQIDSEFVAVFHQAAVGPWISGNMVHLWRSPQVLLPCQRGKSMRQFDVLKLQWGAVNDHKGEININAVEILWREHNRQAVNESLIAAPPDPTGRAVCWALTVFVFQGHCFYHGEVLGMEGSSVAVSTCSGLRYVKIHHGLFS